jgi:hypothetical protein
MLIKIVILLSQVNIIKMSLVTCPSEQNKIQISCKKFFFEKTETENDPDRKLTFQQKTNPDPEQSQKVNPAGL